jgi:hypothetical protein
MTGVVVYISRVLCAHSPYNVDGILYCVSMGSSRYVSRQSPLVFESQKYNNLLCSASDDCYDCDGSDAVQTRVKALTYIIAVLLLLMTAAHVCANVRKFNANKYLYSDCLYYVRC